MTYTKRLVFFAVMLLFVSISALSNTNVLASDDSIVPPLCGFAAEDGRIITVFDTSKYIVSNGTEEDAHLGPVSTSIPAGTYAVSLYSWDGYEGRSSTAQTDESWLVALKNDTTDITSTSPVSDIPDGVEQATVSEMVETHLVIPTDVNSVTAVHAIYPSDAEEYNSVHPICAAFDRIEEEPEEEQGSISICKMTLDAYGDIIDGSEYATSFTIPGLTFAGNGTVKESTGTLPDSVFQTPLSLNTTFISSSHDAECITYDELPFGGYFYGEEILSNDGWNEPRYNDQHTISISSIDDFFPFSGELFTEDESDDVNRDTNADGHIILTEYQPHRTLVVLNQRTEWDFPEGPSCSLISESTGWYGEYFNYPASHPAMETLHLDPVDAYGDPLSDTIPWTADWYDAPYFRFSALDTDLEFGDEYFPFDPFTEERHTGFTGDHEFHFGVHWQALVTAPVDGSYEFRITSDDDSWIYIDGELVVNNSGEHSENTIFASTTLSSTPKKFDIFFAERNTKGSSMLFRFHDQDVVVKPFNPMCLVNEQPVITVIGNNPLLHLVGDTFTDPGATASDAEDGDITSSIVIGGDSVSSTTPIGSYTITYDVMDSDGLSADQKTRIVTVIPTECTDNDSRTVSFGDASVLADTGGIFFESDSRVFGSVFSNGTTISKNDPIVTGDLSVAGKSTINGDHTKHTLTVEGNAYGYGIRNIFVEGSAFSTTEIFSSTNGNGQKTIGGDAYADTIINTVILGDAYVVSSIDVNSPVSGSIIPLVSPPTPLAERNYAISPDDISAWKAVAAAGEDITPVSCPFRPTPGQHIGPAVVNCDMRMKDTDSVVLTGPLWVKGNLTMDDNSSITLDSSYEGNSEVIITDNPDDRISSSRFISESYSSITGTEDEDSAVLVISLNNAYREDPTAESAIRLRNHSFVPFVFAPDGHIFLEHETSTHGIEGYYVHLKNNAYVTGDLASKSITFSDSCTPKNNPPLITVLGDDPIIITEGDTFTDPGATASDAEDGDITSSIVIGGDSVSSTTPVGSYIITYDVMDSDGLSADQKTRTVTVEEKDDNGGGGGEEDPPQCSDDTDNDGDTFSDINDSACHTDGDPDNPDSYDPTIDTENSKPVITRLGLHPVTITKGDSYIDPGATASDAEDGVISSHIITGGLIDLDVVGSYTRTYNVTDSAGLAADEVIRTIIVMPEKAPFPACSDDIDNDSDNLVDQHDPACHTDGDPDNPASYDPSLESENSKPLITVLGDDPIIITEGDTFTDPGATASDAEDGDITSSIVIGGDSVSSTTPVGSYTITYDVMDSDGLSADQKTRTVTVEEKDDNGGGGGEEDPPQCSDDTDNDGDTFSDINDSACHTDGDPDNPDSYDPTIDTENSKPVITRLGGDITANVGDGFTDPGATASDAEDGDITSSIVIGGDSVNTGSAGTYVITYNVTDSAGLAADEVTRTVTVSGGSGSGGGGGSSGGGGGGNGPLGPVSGGGGSSITLQISNEAIALNAEGTAVVTWDTNLQATSRVIFDTLSHNTADKTLYPLTTPKDTSLSTSHSMTIYGLTAGTEYFFRPLSDRTNEEAIGIQLSLTPLSTTIAPPITTPVENIAQCSYLEEFIRLGTNNNPTEVRKLEVFLRDFEGFTDITVDGIYTQTDFDAVTTFQEKYFGDILAPWNHTAGTGYVYITTRKKINEIYCAKAFPLTSDQLREIDAFRTLIQSGVPTDTSIVGSANGSEENHNVAINNTVPAPDTTVSGTTTADIIASLGDTSDGASSNSEGTSSQVARVISALADNKGAVAIIFIGIGVLIIGLIILFVRKESVSAPTNIETPVPELIPSPTTEPTEIKNNSETHPPII